MKPNRLAAALAADRGLVEKELERRLAFGRDVPARLARAMRYAVLGPGKRLRAIMCLEAYRAAGGTAVRGVMPFCTAIEFIHAFSLVHDDLPSMDDDDFRRGRPSLHRRFDEATAILAADALFAFAFELCAAAPVPPARGAAATAVLCRAVGPAGMCGGQMLDVESAAGRSPRGLAVLQRKKTAEFMASALVVGAIVAGAGPGEQRRLKEAGLELGGLFQTTDDLLDAQQASDESRLTAFAVGDAGRVRRRAAAQARAAERAFRGLGARYSLLAELPAAILARSS